MEQEVQISISVEMKLKIEASKGSQIMIPNLWYLWENYKCVQSSIAGSSPAQGVHTWLKKIRIAIKSCRKSQPLTRLLTDMGWIPPKLLCLWQRQKQCLFPKWAYLRKLLSKKSFINNFVCFSSWKREQRQSAAPIYDIQTLRKLFCPAVAKPAPHLLISIPTTVYICLKFSTNGLSVYSHHIWSKIHNTLNWVTCDRDLKKTSISIQIFVLIFFRGRCMNSLCSVQARVCGCSYF